VSSLSKSFINNLQEDLKEQFSKDRSLMSFGEYLDEVATHPHRQIRDTARYLYDAITSFGYHDIQRPYGPQRRYHIFDAPFDDGIDSVSGQEEVQCKLVGLLSDFVREGRSNRLILLNGPNGSAKTSMINCLQRGLEVYSASEEGALYTFSWLFPTKQSEGGGIGFGQAKGHSGVNSYSELGGTSIDARVANELRDHPLLLLPKAARLTFLKSVFEQELKAEATEQNHGLDDAQLGKEIESRIGSLPRYLTDGSLSPQSATIFETLLKSYQGDISEVLKHIQVERFLISRKYRRGATTVDPQLRVDAQARQVTADRSLASLPTSLQHLNLFEPMGHLVEGNRGVIEYNDLLKRPVEAFKYLLSTTESGAVRLDHLTIYIDAVMIGSCNVDTLQAFIEMPDFASFKGRIELVRVPYLRDVEREEEVYQSTINSLQKRVMITPDVSHWLAKWAVMTRLERPQPVHFPSEIRTVIEGMTPHDKLELYSEGRARDELSLEKRRSLQREITTLYYEPHVGGIYEGWLGASPRELKGLLLSLGRPADDQRSSKEQTLEAELEKGYHFISPLRLFTALHLLCKEESVYPFLRRKVSGHFYQPKVYVQELKEIYLSRLRISFFNAFGLIAPDNELTQLNEYIHQLRYKMKGEKVHNPHTGQYDEPNEQFMREVEKRLGIKSDIDRARDSIIQQIAKWKIENPNADLDYKVIFEEELRALRLSYLKETEEVAIERRDELMIYLSGEGQLDDQSQQKAEMALDYLKTTLGYHEDSLLEVLHSLEFSDA
jgi:serine protein kinase